MIFNSRGTIRKALAQLRAEGGPNLDLAALAKEVELPVEWLQRLDQGQLGRVNLSDLERLCRILGRSPNDLLGYEADE